MSETCSIDWCDRPRRGKKPYCDLHRQRLRKGADMDLAPLTPDGAGEEFLRSLVGTEIQECIFWPYARFKQGPGHAHFNGKGISASRLMCIFAHGAPPFERAEAAHNCGMGHEACVNPNHLRWDTRKGNAMDTILHGTSTKGVKNAMSKLTEAEVLHVLGMRGSGLSQREVGEMFNISQTHVGSIWRGERWAHIKE